MNAPDLGKEGINARIAYWLQVLATFKAMTPDDSVVLFGSFDGVPRAIKRIAHHLAVLHRLHNGPGHWMDAVNRDEEEFNSARGRDGVRFAGD